MYYYILGALQAFTAIGAIPAGIAFLMNTTGARMGATPELLADSPLKSFLLPGLFLVLINGLAMAAASFLSFSRRRYAGHAGVALGIILSLWILIQVAWIGLSSFLQPFFLLVGLADIFLGWKILRAERL